MISAAFKTYVKIMELLIWTQSTVFVEKISLDTDVRQGLTRVTESFVIMVENLTMTQLTVFVE